MLQRMVLPEQKQQQKLDSTCANILASGILFKYEFTETHIFTIQTSCRLLTVYQSKKQSAQRPLFDSLSILSFCFVSFFLKLHSTFAREYKRDFDIMSPHDCLLLTAYIHTYIINALTSNRYPNTLYWRLTQRPLPACAPATKPLCALFYLVRTFCLPLRRKSTLRRALSDSVRLM